MSSWLTAGAGLLRQAIPQKIGLTDLAAPGAFGRTSAFAVPQKMGVSAEYGINGAPMGPGVPAKLGLDEIGAWLADAGQTSGISKIGMDAFAPVAAIEQSASIMQGGAIEQALTGPGPTSGVTGGGIGSLGGEYAVLDKYNTAFQQAAAKYGMPANYLKALAAIERGWEGTSKSGALGIMQVMPKYWSDLGYNLNDPAQNIMAGAHILDYYYNQVKNEAIRIGMDPWEAAARAYFSGSNWKNAGTTDAYGTRVDVYGDRFNQFLGQLGGGRATSGGAQGAPTTGGGWQGAFQSMFGTSVAGDYGYNAPNSLGLYGYGVEYGMDGNGHTGIDQPMNFNTPYYAPMGGIVTCAGTGRGSGAGGGGCGAFNDTGNAGPGGAIQGVGRVEVQLDNGAVLIFGHSRTSALQPGQRFNAGALLGTSGGMNGPHVHLEARVRDSSTNSGWRIVDPRTVLGGAVPVSGTSSGGYGAPATSGAGFDQVARIRQVLGGGAR